MGENSNIEWTDHTFNPWIGCTKVSPGCLYCYAEQLDITRFSKVLGDACKACPVSHWGKGAPRHRTSEDNWKQPLRWNRSAHERSQLFGNMPWARAALDQQTHRPRVFCASLADWLDEEVPIEWLADLLDLIRRTPNLDWLLLTKRPQNWRSRLQAVWDNRDDDTMETAVWVFNWLRGDVVPGNIWIGTTVEDQARANERLPLLRKIPARVRFLSCEPLLEEVDLAKACDWGSAFDGSLPGIHWVICGGESGDKDKARHFCTEWAWGLLLQCRRAGVPFFMKQLGSSPITSNFNALEWPEETHFADDLLDTQWAAGGSVRLANKKGADMAEWPEELKVQEFPR